MKPILEKLDFQRLLLLLLFSLLVTLLITPNLALVPSRYDEGDIITKTLIIPDNITLVDARSTDLRRNEALDDFPPIYDFDTHLLENTTKLLNKAFQAMRDQLSDLQRSNGDAQAKIRANSLEQIATISENDNLKVLLSIVEKEKQEIIQAIGQLSDIPKPTPEQLADLEKLRFDLLATEAQREGLVNSRKQLRENLNDLRKSLKQLQADFQANRKSEGVTIASMKDAFEKQLGVQLENSQFETLRNSQFDPQLESKVITLLQQVYIGKIVSAPESLPQQKKVIQIQTLDSPKLERFEALESVRHVAEMREELKKKGTELGIEASDTSRREFVVTLAQQLLRPNLTANKGETERQKQELLKSMSPVYFNLKKGDVVARAGDLATAQQVEIINALNAYNRQNPKYPQLIGIFMIVLLSLVIIYRLIAPRKEGETRPGISQLLMMAILVVVTLLLAQMILAIVPALTTLYDFVPANTYNYLIPAALTSMLAGILLRLEVAIFLGFVTSIFLGILLSNSLGFFLFSVMGSLVASIPMRNYDTRYALWQQGLRISGVNVIVLIVIALMDQQNPVGWSILLDLSAGIANGLAAAFLTSTILPLLERAFDITTNMRLLELSNMNHPALKELAVRAPGTYHHSIVVGNLSESAAGGISANPLLVRVASYYHDLGKMLCPLYFVENQHQKNYHDDLPAKTSTRIIINHVKDGQELAKRYRLGRAIQEILEQHHGTSLVKYFFHKAGNEQDTPETDPEEEQFRYPGPKPQSKEAGLVMVADVTEAATRSLDEPSQDSIREMVQRLTTNIYMDGQLDESGMTFNDLNFIEKTFTKMLLSIHHHRISYPEMKVAPDTDEADEPQAEQNNGNNPTNLGKRRASRRS